MKKTSDRTEEIERFILENVSDHPEDIARVTAEHFHISRQAVHRHLKRLVDNGQLTAAGTTRSRTYAIAPLASTAFTLNISPALQEDEVWRQRVEPLLKELQSNVKAICFYGFTEMLNNVIDHSESVTAVIAISVDPSRVTIWIDDAGVGIFHKIARELGLADERHAILELAKGKLTTDPKRHSGEGIFFTSRMFDFFHIKSGDLTLACEDGEDWLLEPKEPTRGTHVGMEISARSSRTTQEVFDRYSSSEDDYGFTRTRVPVALARYGDENLISRSQAKRLLARFEKFREVILDFSGVETIGQAFADEVFRVFKNQHPEVTLVPIDASPEVMKMIRRAEALGKTGG